MSATVVYVHGNGNKVRADLLKQEWDTALFGPGSGARSVMAYWAPIRYPAPLPDVAFDEAELVPASPLETAAPLVEPPEDFVAAVLREVAPSLGSPFEAAAQAGAPAEAAGLEEWLRRATYEADALAEGESAEAPAATPLEALPLPAVLRKAAFRALVKLTFKDVYAYFFGGSGEAMRAVVRAALRSAPGPVVVIGHSLGSIIAYDVLREDASRDLDVPLFLTIGSPLAVTEIQDHVRRPLEVPAPVAAWRNVCDARDFVALDKTIRPEYAPPDKCTDFLVINNSANHHGAREYLRTIPVREPVRALAG